MKRLTKTEIRSLKKARIRLIRDRSSTSWSNSADYQKIEDIANKYGVSQNDIHQMIVKVLPWEEVVKINLEP